MSEKSDAKARKLDLRSAVLKELSNYPPKHFKQVTLSILGLLRNATPHDSATLTGHPHWRRIDVGEYRVIYHFDADTVHVSVVGKRNDAEVYRLLKR
jgi:mRNA interferase RelE/StbE